MQVAALAEALASSRHADGTISLGRLDARLTLSGLDEFVGAVMALPERSDPEDRRLTVEPEHAWF